MATDRELLKRALIGLVASCGLTDAIATVDAAQCHSRDFRKVGTENAETNVAETLMFSVRRAARPKSITYLTGTNVASDNTDYVVIAVKKKTAGGASVTVAQWNTHGGAQGAITENIPAALSVRTNSDADLAAGDTLHYTITKAASGKAVAIGTFTVDLDEGV